jgi:hypothetical protein
MSGQIPSNNRLHTDPVLSASMLHVKARLINYIDKKWLLTWVQKNTDN